MSLQRSSLNRIPGRLVFNGISLFSKGGTTIDTDQVYSQVAVEVAGMGKIDNRDNEAHDEITITPDGRVSPTIARAWRAWPPVGMFSRAEPTALATPQNPET